MFVGGEDSEAVMRLQQVACGRMVVVVRKCFRDGRSLVEQARERIPQSVTAECDMLVFLSQLLTSQTKRVAVSRIDHIHLGIIPCIEITDELVVDLRIGAELSRSRVLYQITF